MVSSSNNLVLPRKIVEGDAAPARVQMRYLFLSNLPSCTRTASFASCLGDDVSTRRCCTIVCAYSAQSVNAGNSIDLHNRPICADANKVKDWMT